MKKYNVSYEEALIYTVEEIEAAAPR